MCKIETREGGKNKTFIKITDSRESLKTKHTNLNTGFKKTILKSEKYKKKYIKYSFHNKFSNC